uniref:Neuroligin 1, isoform D n=2 Tax=Drosophila melanogaster TaxID=7227 RepID=Q9VIC7_DROME|nr:neuroligin 1, isoform E [Drosophila melanogaster]NP_731172.2 neuroligin 1, isoform D [Drosophila melanogaster]AAF53998.3 neuroligin 1, isoform D [Drosophila melanogaster]ABC86275.1 RE29404p [Drosophila melanogaster]AFH06285.1 neuroligin 1, isoform E [Drosophila melanogaster]|eukprot:NP_001246966.1 neuroligin 1, isoform E [Drosophila melanogaster]
MKFRLAAFWLFLLTVGGNHKLLSHVSPMGVAAEKQPLHKGNELENAMKLREAPKQSRVIGDITTTIQPDSDPGRSIGHQALRRAKAPPPSLELHFRQNLNKLFAGDETTHVGHTNATDNTTAAVLATDEGSSEHEPSTTHHPERRHVVPDKLQYTQEIQVKQGRLMGITRRFQVTSGLRQVDQFLGLPYAEAPTGNRRFMPPGAPLPWQGLKIARHLPPVCPQKLPDLSPHGSENMSRARHKHLSRLLPYLRTESEDCLYLNLYVPHEEPQSTPKQYAVLVYLHGESFEWNSGNPYDGSVLSSYGEVIVVTVNYRLGVLGFLRPSIDAHNIANYALLDQIAALHWIKENIEAFGGDNSRVTLMGHSTGAACVNYLMVSPVASGLFHRAILMSGSAMSDWAASNQSLQLTMQIAHALECPLNEHVEAEDDDVLLDCLRHRRYQDILHIPTALTQFSTSLGPIVDGHVIPNQPYKVMGHYTEHFSRYDLLFGITESESYHTLAALALEEGLRENERDNLLRFYMQSRFDIRPDLALAATLKKYQDMYNNPIKATNLEHRDVVLDILSDARVVGPLLQTGMFHADVNRRNYMYVFGHNSATGPFAHLPHSIMGEELAFIFGAPLAAAGPFPSGNYTVQEKLLSEAVMAYWTNFVKTGNPKAPWKGIFINSHALEWDRYDLDWPEFNRRAQAYLNIGIPPTVGYKYRQIYMNFWNKELPDELNQIAAIQEQLQKPGQEVITGHMSKYGPRDHGAEDPVRTLKLLLQEPSLAGPTQSGESTETAAENMYNAPPTFGHVHKMQGGSDFEDLVTSTNSLESGEDHPQAPPETVAKSEATMQLLIALITIIIVLNLLIYGTFLLRQRRRRAKALPFPAPKLGGTILSYDGANDEELKRCSKSRDGDDSFVLEMTRKSNTYEAIKTGQRSLSCSTVDTHTKVCEWMSSQEAPKSGSFNTATPPPQPILSDGRLIICQDIEVADAALLIPQHMHEPQHYEMLLQRQHSALTEPSDEILQQQYPLRNHSHSHSDPVDMILAADEQVTSFVHADDVDINVTSRDDSDGLEVIPLTSAQQLELLRQRNYPKVLPTEQDLINSSYKRNSLPPQNFNAPLPPPRTISNTLGRRRRDSSNITTSPLQVARDCGGEDEDLKEPQITQNTLIVGPIVPKSPASSLKRVKRMPESSAMTALSGSFQSFEAVPPAHETTPPQGGERTECIYAIRPSPGSCSWAAPNGDLYAQPMKSSSRNSLIPRPTKPAESQSQATPAGPAGESLGSTGMATASRIPQLQRQASGKDLQARTATDNTANPLGCQPRTDSTISSGSSASYASTTDSSSSSSTGTVRTELQQFQPAPGRSITTNI